MNRRAFFGRVVALVAVGPLAKLLPKAAVVRGGAYEVAIYCGPSYETGQYRSVIASANAAQHKYNALMTKRVEKFLNDA